MARSQTDFSRLRYEIAFMANATKLGEPERKALLSRIEDVLNRDVRHGLDRDGGGVEVVGIDDDRIVQVRMLGSCQGCSSSLITLTMGIERAIKAEIPEIRFVEAVL